jgi:hypothetical protein
MLLNSNKKFREELIITFIQSHTAHFGNIFTELLPTTMGGYAGPLIRHDCTKNYASNNRLFFHVFTAIGTCLLSRCHDMCTKFQEDWPRHSIFNGRGFTDAQHGDHISIFLFFKYGK